MQIYANLRSTGFSVGLVGIFHKEAAILSLLYFVLVSGRHNPFSKAWEFIIRRIRASTKGDGQHTVVRPALPPPCPQRHPRSQGSASGQDPKHEPGRAQGHLQAPVVAIALRSGAEGGDFTLHVAPEGAGMKSDLSGQELLLQLSGTWY